MADEKTNISFIIMSNMIALGTVSFGEIKVI